MKTALIIIGCIAAIGYIYWMYREIKNAPVFDGRGKLIKEKKECSEK